MQEVTNAYLEQCEAIEAVDGRIILMASRALAAAARHAEDYAFVYATVLAQVRQPVILHWLGPMFDPALEGYWGSSTIPAATENCLGIIRAHIEKIDGIQISLLDADLEVNMRRHLPPGVRMYTGDDFNYDRLILGNGQHSSDALLGIFDAIAPAASLALSALDAGDIPRYHQLLSPTVPLSRHIFAAPTHHYKAGVVFLAFLNGFQSHFRMVRGLESARSVGIEPLHPMYAAERSVVVTLKQAIDLADQLSSPAAQVVVDVFHVWWDPEVMQQIERARGKIAGFHVSDWPVPLPGILMGRAMMGDGVIDLRQLRQAVDASGYDGPIEVEIFNDEIWKSADDGLLERIQRCFIEHV